MNQKYVGSSSSIATIRPSNIIIKSDRMLVRIDCDDSEEISHKCFGRNPIGWKELMVKLKPAVIELYKSKAKKRFIISAL